MYTMQKTNAPSLDLNLLTALDALLDTASITRMGERLGLSQPAASRVMAKLRQSLADPLLVRTSKGYVLTPGAQALATATRQALDLASRVFDARTFDALSSTRRFRIATTDYGSLTVVQGLLQSMALQAPQAGLDLQPWSASTLADLERGALDLALYADDPLQGDFHTRDLFRETYAVLLPRKHPLLQGRAPDAALQARELAPYPRLSATYPHGQQLLVDDALARMGHALHHSRATVPYFLAAPWLLKGSDSIMLCPRRAAQALAEHPAMAWRPLNNRLCDFSYRMVWHERAHRDAGLAWLRRLILQSSGKIVPSP